MYEGKGYVDPAYEPLLVDVLEQMLLYARQPDRVAYTLSEHVRDMAGARLVVLLPSEERWGQLSFTVCPESQRDLAESLEVEALFKVAMQTDSIMLWDKRSQDHAAVRMLSALQMKNCLSVPLCVGNLRMGTLIIMDISFTGSIDSLVCVMDKISGVLGLILRNAGFHQDVEQLVEERMGELTQIDETLLSEVNKRKQAEEALQESEASLVKAQKIAHLGNYVLDVINDRAVCSDEFYSILGLVPQAYFSYKSFLTFLHPDDREIFDRNIHEVQDQVKTYKNDFKIVRQDGSVRIIHGEGKMVIDETGKSTQMVGIIQDITEHKAIGESLRKLSRVVKDSPSTVVITDVRGVIEYVNPKFTELTGYTFEETKGKTPCILKSGKTPPEEYTRLWDTILAGNEWRGEFVNKKKNGELYWESAIILPIKDDTGSITHFIAIKDDITERKRAEENMKLTQFSVDKFTDSVIGINKEGCIIYINEVTCQKLGYTRDELLSMSIWDIDPNYPYERFLELWNVTKRSGAVNFESVHVRKDGTSYPGEVSANYLKFKDKEYVGISDRDITERKRAEKELKDTKAQAELYLDLMSHDINNLNQVAIGYLELINGIVEDEKLKELISKPIDAVNNSTYLIENVMKLQKAKMGKLKAEAVDLNSVLSELQIRYSNVPDKDVTIHYSPDPGCFVMADGLIKDLFSNLIWNAIKHSIRESIQVHLRLKRHNDGGKDYYRVTVEDDGPGIPDEQKEKVFGRFQRGRTKASGKGLGLYLVKSLVEGYRGRVWVEDRVQGDHTKGTRFVVMLPVIEK